MRKRALNGFVITRDGEPIDIFEMDIGDGFWNGVTVVGYAASLNGPDRLGVQTGHWWRPHPDSCLYLRIYHVKNLEWDTDISFRNG